MQRSSGWYSDTNHFKRINFYILSFYMHFLLKWLYLPCMMGSHFTKEVLGRNNWKQQYFISSRWWILAGPHALPICLSWNCYSKVRQLSQGHINAFHRIEKWSQTFLRQKRNLIYSWLVWQWRLTLPTSSSKVWLKKKKKINVKIK